MESTNLKQSFITCIETSNKLLNTYYTETEPGLKQDLIKKMIETNAELLGAAYEEGAGEPIAFESDEMEYCGQFFAIPIDSHTEAINLLTEVRDHNLDEKDMYKAIANAIILLTGKEDE